LLIVGFGIAIDISSKRQFKSCVSSGLKV